jgi:AraC-like DNA-binding protein
MPRQGLLISELVDFHFKPIPANWSGYMHVHHFHQLDVMLQGRARAHFDEGRKVALEPGVAVLMPPLCRHDFDTEGGCLHAVFKLHVNPRYWQVFGTAARSMHLPDHVLRIVRNAGDRFVDDAPLAWELVSSVSMLCLASMVDAADTVEPSDGLESFRNDLWHLLEQVEAEPDNLWTVEELAERCHLSRDHFSRCFTRVLGTSPRRYLLETRIRMAAQQLIQSPPQPIKRIADHAGYASVHAFTRAFTRVLGVSPAAYRRG